MSWAARWFGGPASGRCYGRALPANIARSAAGSRRQGCDSAELRRSGGGVASIACYRVDPGGLSDDQAA